ncbi:ATP-binding cassette domain-containing protein, partial [Bacillus altitudinis]
DLSYEIMDMSLFEGVNSSVRQGEVIGIIGKNGAGKSTLLQLITGERQPSSGQIQWVGPEAEILMIEQETESYISGQQSPLEIKLLEKWQVPAVGYVRMSGGEK